MLTDKKTLGGKTELQFETMKTASRTFHFHKSTIDPYSVELIHSLRSSLSQGALCMVNQICEVIVILDGL